MTNIVEVIGLTDAFHTYNLFLCSSPEDMQSEAVCV